MAQETKNTALSFDASQVEPQKPGELIPAGWYHTEITDAEVKATRGAKGGTRATFEFTVASGEFKGRKIFAGINVKNANAQAQEIGQRELSAICHAVGIINVTDLKPFVGRQLQVKVKIKKASTEEKNEGYEDRNEPAGYKAAEGAAATASAPAFAPPAPGSPVAPPAAPPAASVFPPEGWQPHPTAPGYFWNPATNDVKSEADLKAISAPVAAPVPAPAPAMPPAPATPAPAPVAAFPPAGWSAHPQAPGWFYEVANPTNMKTEEDLKASLSAAPAGPPVPPAGATGAVPPWKTPA